MRYLLAVFFVLLSSATAPAQQSFWPQFHGPTGDCVAQATDLPLDWSESENIVWKTVIHDFGWASPVIWQDQVWMTTANEDGTKMYAVCVDARTGEIVHDLLLFDDQQPTDDLKTNSFASPTPVVEPHRVYVHFGTYGTACLDTDTGEMLWKRRDLHCDHLRGPGSSPYLEEDRLFLIFDGADRQFVVALDKKTGRTIWKKPRSTDYGDMDGDLRKAYDTPLMIDVDGRKQLVCTGAHETIAYDPPTGEEIWKVGYKGFSNASRPVFHEGMVLVNSGFSRAKLLAVDPRGRGDVTESHVRWRLEKGVPLKPTPVVVGERLYLPGDDGILTCVDVESGKMIWQERLGGNFSASPLVAEGRIYLPDESGITTVIAPSSENERCEILAENELENGCMASPAAVGNAVFLRTKTHLYRIEKSREH